MGVLPDTGGVDRDAGQARIAKSLLGEQEVHEAGDNVLRALAGYAEAQLGVLYRIDGHMLKLAGSYACTGATRELPLRHGLAFKPFRAGKMQHHPGDGPGLGLYIVKHFVDAHGGQVELHSSREDGTAIRIAAPR